jgi:tartrate dehydratase alpha subunit/fumarate hydratase class I-like protein
MPRAGTAGPDPNRCWVFRSVSVTGAPSCASMSCGIGSGGPSEAAALAQRGKAAAARPAAADPERTSARRRVRDVPIGMSMTSLVFVA